MKLKYYLRGLGIGIIVSTIVLTVSFCGRDTGTTREMTDEEIIERAMELGMVMPEEDTDGTSTEEGEDVQTDPDWEGADVLPDTDVAQIPDGGDAPSGPEESGTSDIGQNAVVDAGNMPVREGTYRLFIEQGDVCRVVCEKLAANGVIEDAEALRTYLFEIGYASNMSIGYYDVPYGLTNEQVAQVLMAGPVAVE